MSTQNLKATVISSPRNTLTAGGKSFLYLSSAYGHRELHCAECGQPIANGQQYHCDRYNTAVCHRHSVSFCAVCERIILGPRILVPNVGPTCDVCGRPRTIAELQTVVNTIYKFYSEKRIFIPQYSVNLLPAQLMDEKYRPRFNFMPFGVAWDGYPGGLQLPSGMKRYHIDLMSQQSPTSLARTLAHEVLHLWQYNRGIKAPPQYAEGFCNLGSYQVLAGMLRSSEAMVMLKHLMEDPDPSYGVAFRELKIMHDVNGWDSVIEAMKSFK